jgi:2-isopropylmalate synthase
MKAEHGFDLPRRLQIEFSKTIQHITEDSGTEISPGRMWDAFEAEYLPSEPRLSLVSHELRSDADGRTTITAQLRTGDEHRTVVGEGNGPIDAFVHALRQHLDATIDVVDYAEHAIGKGSEATAVAYVESVAADGTVRWGVGTDPNIITASLKAVLGALDRQSR